mgnify:CR=1 FL=1
MALFFDLRTKREYATHEEVAETIKRDGSFVLEVPHLRIRGIALEFKTGLPYCCDLDLNELQAKGISPRRLKIGLAHFNSFDLDYTTEDDTAENLALLMNAFHASLLGCNFHIDLEPGRNGYVLKELFLGGLPFMREEAYYRAMYEKCGSFGPSPRYVADLIAKASDSSVGILKTV